MKKTLTWGLAILCVCSLVGCSSNVSEQASSQSPSTEEYLDEYNQETEYLEEEISGNEEEGFTDFTGEDPYYEISSGQCGNYTRMSYAFEDGLMVYPHYVCIGVNFIGDKEIIVPATFTNTSDQAIELNTYEKFKCIHNGISNYCHGTDYDGITIEPGGSITTNLEFVFPQIYIGALLDSVMVCPDGTEIKLGPIPQAYSDYFSAEGTYIEYYESNPNRIMSIIHFIDLGDNNYREVKVHGYDCSTFVIEFRLDSDNRFGNTETHFSIEGGVPQVFDLKYEFSKQTQRIEEVHHNVANKVNEPYKIDMEQALLDLEEEGKISTDDIEDSDTDYTKYGDDEPEVSDPDYIFPDSDKSYLSEDDFMDIDGYSLRIARNEIYARHGRLFTSEELQEYFDSKDWYNGSIPGDEFDESVLNEYEKKNLKLIASYEE